jgi:proline iminopeptidase
MLVRIMQKLAVVCLALAAAFVGFGCGGDDAPEPEPEQPCIGDPNVCLDVHTEGSGSQVLIMIADGPGWSRDYLAPVQTALASDALTVATFDHRGVRRSTVPDPVAYTMVDYVADVEAIRDRLGAETVHVLGHGFGASVAWGYLASHPDRVASLINIGGYTPASGSYFAAKSAIADRILFLQTATFIPDPLPTDVGDDCTARLQATWPVFLADPQLAIPSELQETTCTVSVEQQTLNQVYDVGHDFSAAAGVFTGPALVLFGKADPLNAVLGETSVAALANAAVEFDVLPNSGHLPWVERQTEFVDKVKATIGVP